MFTPIGGKYCMNIVYDNGMLIMFRRAVNRIFPTSQTHNATVPRNSIARVCVIVCVYSVAKLITILLLLCVYHTSVLFEITNIIKSLYITLGAVCTGMGFRVRQTRNPPRAQLHDGFLFTNIYVVIM